MHVLIVKTSSMGDIIHTLPAITDAASAIPNVKFDWVVEEKFAEIPHWHPAVDNVIKVAWRRWRKQLLSATTRAEWRSFRQSLNSKKYDLIIDAQGLIKSALFSRLAKGMCCGFASDSVRERLASFLYHRSFSVARNQHAVTRLRYLFSQALGYQVPAGIPNYGIDKNKLLTEKKDEDYLVFLHGTTWQTKHWPEEYWTELAKKANQAGLIVKLAWGSESEMKRAERIAAHCSRAVLLPRLDLLGMAKTLLSAKAVITVDTGLGHLAAALDVPTISLYGPTNPELTGALGRTQVHLSTTFPCSPCLSRECIYQNNTGTTFSVNPPCFSTLTPHAVWSALCVTCIDNALQD